MVTAIVAGIFDGSPHVALGDGTHWQQPHTILDKAGERVVLNSYWDFTKKQWVKTDRCDPEGGAPAEGHLTSAIAMDWDHDGDFDLVTIRVATSTCAATKAATKRLCSPCETSW